MTHGHEFLFCVATLRSISLDSSEGSSDIAAAIVHGAPASRRRAFLRGHPQRACSLEELVPGDLNRSRKRRSLNLESASATSTPAADFLSLSSSHVSGGVAAGSDQLQQQTVGVAYGGDQLLSCTSPIEEGNEDVHESTPPSHHLPPPSTLTLDAATPSLDVVTPPSVAAASSTNGTHIRKHCNHIKPSNTSSSDHNAAYKIYFVKVLFEFVSNLLMSCTHAHAHAHAHAHTHTRTVCIVI